MTVETQIAKAGPYSGAGTTGPFTVDFRFLENSHLEVIRTSSTGVDTTLALTTDYTVTGAGLASGSITLVTALAVGQKLTIIRNVPFLQDADYIDNDSFPAESHERSLDLLTMQTQQLREAVSRAALLPVTSSADSEALVAAITLLASDIDELLTVAGNISAVTTVADDLNEPVSEINTVAASIANVNTVGNAIANVNTVATNIADVNTVVTNIAAVQNTSTNMSAVIAAPTQASAAASSASAAAASAAAAAASSASGMYSAVQDKSANYTIALADAGDLIRMNTASGALTVTLPAISSLPDGFNVTVVKWTGDINATTVQRSGSNTINGAPTYLLDAQYKSATFVADLETNTWFASGAGGAGSNNVVDAFTGNGVTTAFTLSGDPGTKNNTLANINGSFQLKSTYSLVGSVLTFSSAPPNDVAIEVQWTQPLAIGVPSDATVSTAKIQNLAVTPAKLDRAYAELAAAQSFTAAQRGAVSALTDGATITPNFALANNFSVTLAGNRTLANPTNIVAGQSGVITVTQDATGSRTLAFGSVYKFAAGAAPTLTTTASAVDDLAYYVESATRIVVKALGDAR